MYSVYDQESNPALGSKPCPNTNLILTSRAPAFMRRSKARSLNRVLRPPRIHYPCHAMATAADPRKLRVPPAIPVAAWLLSWGLGRIWPIHVPWPAWTRWLGWLLLMAPFSIGSWAAATFRRHQTVLNPQGHTTAIVTEGPFRYSRNPMYLTLLLAYVGGMLAFHLPWAAILLVPVFLTLQYGVIVREERYLQAAFGEQYAAYQRRVRRWL
jgi:protein-S-isoprenylcysteine O-methyltransferase Ste14